MFREDFESERRDREKAAGKYDEDLCRLQKEMKDLTSQMQLEKAERIRLEQEIKKLKNTSKFPTKTLGMKSTTAVCTCYNLNC